MNAVAMASHATQNGKCSAHNAPQQQAYDKTPPQQQSYAEQQQLMARYH